MIPPIRRKSLSYSEKLKAMLLAESQQGVDSLLEGRADRASR